MARQTHIESKSESDNKISPSSDKHSKHWDLIHSLHLLFVSCARQDYILLNTFHHSEDFLFNYNFYMNAVFLPLILIMISMVVIRIVILSQWFETIGFLPPSPSFSFHLYELQESVISISLLIVPHSSTNTSHNLNGTDHHHRHPTHESSLKPPFFLVPTHNISVLIIPRKSQRRLHSSDRSHNGAFNGLPESKPINPTIDYKY